MNTIKQITKLHTDIERAIFYTDSNTTYDELIGLLHVFANLINDFEGDNDEWLYIGECSSATPDSLLIGAYWHLTEWHGGQYHPTYAAMCSIGQVFQPGMTNGPEEESSEHDVYTALNTMAEKHSENKSVAHS